MPKYRVKENNSVTTVDGEKKAGELLDLSEEEAASIPHAVEKVEEEESKGAKKKEK